MKRILTLVMLLALPLPAAGLSLEGLDLPERRTVEGETMQLVGAGVRNKWFFDVGVLSVYAWEKQCDPQALVDADRPKLLRLDLLRDLPGARLGSGMSDSIRDHLPKHAPAELEQQLRAFQSYFEGDLAKGTSLEFVYLPGKGTLVRQDGRQLGPALEGLPFAQVLWDVYFGQDSCCDGTKKDIIETCLKRS